MVEDSDLVVFHPLALGEVTSGAFLFHFDGSDVGLTDDSEDIDGVHELDGGDLAISTTGTSTVGWTFRDEDVAHFALTGSGQDTTGSWTAHLFDGSDVGFDADGDHDVDALSLEGPSRLYFSTLGPWTQGSTGGAADVGLFEGVLGTATTGSTTLHLDLSALGIDASENVDGLTLRP